MVPGLGLHRAPLRTFAGNDGPSRRGHPGAGLCLVCGFAQLHGSLTPGVGGCTGGSEATWVFSVGGPKHPPHAEASGAAVAIKAAADIVARSGEIERIISKLL